MKKSTFEDICEEKGLNAYYASTDSSKGILVQDGMSIQNGFRFQFSFEGDKIKVEDSNGNKTVIDTEEGLRRVLGGEDLSELKHFVDLAFDSCSEHTQNVIYSIFQSKGFEPAETEEETVSFLQNSLVSFIQPKDLDAIVIKDLNATGMYKATKEGVTFNEGGIGEKAILSDYQEAIIDDILEADAPNYLEDDDAIREAMQESGDFETPEELEAAVDYYKENAI